MSGREVLLKISNSNVRFMPRCRDQPRCQSQESTPCTFPNCQRPISPETVLACLVLLEKHANACKPNQSQPMPTTGERAVNGSCVACPAGFTNEARDDTCDICYDTGCDFIPCAKDHYVAGTGYDRVCHRVQKEPLVREV